MRLFFLQLCSLKRCLAAVFAAVCVQAQAQGLVLDQLIVQALESHPEVRSAEFLAQAKDSELTAAKLSQFPALTVDSGYNNRGPTASIQLQQPLWTAGAVGATIRQAELQKKSALASIEATRYDLATRTIDAWQELVSGVELQRVYSETLKELERLEQTMQRRVNQQVSARIELDLIGNRILQTKDNLLAARQREMIAREQLAQLIGSPITEGDVSMRQPLDPLVNEVAAQTQKLNPNEISEASFHHPLVVQAAYAQYAAKEGYKVEAASQWPQLFATYRHEYLESVDEDRDTLGVGFQYAPGAGFSSFARADSRKAEAYSLEYDQEATRRELARNLLTEYQAVVSAQTRLGSLENSVRGASVVLASYERQFIAGRKQWLDLLNSAVELQNYRVEQAENKLQLVSGYYRILAGLGDLGLEL